MEAMNEWSKITADISNAMYVLISIIVMMIAMAVVVCWQRFEIQKPIMIEATIRGRNQNRVVIIAGLD